MKHSAGHFFKVKHFERHVVNKGAIQIQFFIKLLVKDQFAVFGDVMFTGYLFILSSKI